MQKKKKMIHLFYVKSVNFDQFWEKHILEVC